MPLDPNIYSQLQPNVAMGLGDVVNRYVDQTQSDAERKNRLAQMAQAGELQGLQLQQAKNELAQMPQKLAEAKQAKEKLYMQGVAQEIAASPERKDEIIRRHMELSGQSGIPTSHFEWLSSDLASAKDVQDRALFHANPQEYMKLALESKFRKPEKVPDWKNPEYWAAQRENERFKAGLKKQNVEIPPPTKPQPGFRNVMKDGGWVQEAVPGSKAWQDLKSKEATDRAFVQNTVPSIDKNIKDIDKFMSMEGFENIFGLTGDMPNILPSSRAAAAVRDQVVGAMETAGFNLMKSTSGSAGTMSQQEWPKMQTYMNIIKNSSDPSQVRDALIGAKESYARMKEIAKESYMNEWGSGQFGDPSVIERMESGKPALPNAPARSNTPPVRSIPHPQDSEAVQWARSNPNDPRSAAILKANQ